MMISYYEHLLIDNELPTPLQDSLDYVHELGPTSNIVSPRLAPNLFHLLVNT